MKIPEIVKNHVLKNCKRMPETPEELNQYLDLINHAKDYEEAFNMERLIGKEMMKKLGFKTTTEIKKEALKIFKS